MHRPLLLLAGLGLTTLAAGCCMCDAPYDYCGPTFLARPGEACVSDARMNSAFTPYIPYDGQPVTVLEGIPPGATIDGAPQGAPPNATFEDRPTEIQDSPSDTLPRPDVRLKPQQEAPATPTPASSASEPTMTRATPGRPVSLRR